MRNEEPQRGLGQLLSKERIELEDGMLGQLERFAALLLEWNGTHNLTGAKTLDAVYDNILDALYPITFVDRPGSLLDVGTGAGFPGLVLAIVWPQIRTVLTEPRNKRAAFLRYAATELGLSQVTVERRRVEEVTYAPFGLITSRAVTDTALLLQLTAHLRDAGTQFLFYKGAQAQEELAALETQPNYVIVQNNKRNYVWIK